MTDNNNPDSDSVELNFKSQVGVEIFSPNKCLRMPDFTQTWAEKTRGELIWKLKKRQANLNRLYIFLLMMPATILVLAIVGGLCLLIKHSLMGILIGILGGQMMIICYLKLSLFLETNPDFVKVKHKRKTYYL